MNGSRRFHVAAGGTLRGELRLPGDKSISHRAVMLAAIAEGISEIHGFLRGEDCLHTLAAFRALGVSVEDGTSLRIHGVGLYGLSAPAGCLDLGNSGTSMRLLAGLLAGQDFACTLTGDASLSRRPMRRIVEPLKTMGARIETSAAGTAPLHIQPAGGLRGIRYATPVASAQVKSGLLLAGLYADGVTEVIEPAASRDHTERMLASLGVELQTSPGRAALRGGQRLRGGCIDVPADLSSAAFFLVGASIASGSDLLLRDVGVNPTRTGVIDILRDMGADISLLNPRRFGAEPVADLRVRSARLHGIDIGTERVAAAIDEFPALFVAAACAEGCTRITGAAELRIKESDRIQAMCDGLTALGVAARALPDGAIIEGGELRGGRVDSQGDHRVAMSLAIAALRATESIEILDVDNVDTSFPGFAALAGEAGLRIRETGGGERGLRRTPATS